MLLRLAWLVAVAGITTAGPTDQNDYVRIGQAWSEGRFATGLQRTPLYPAILAVVDRFLDLTGDALPQRLVVGLLQVALAGAAVALVGAWVHHLTRSRAGGLAAAAVLAAWPNQIFGAGVLMSEMVSTPLILFAAAAALWRPTDDPPRWVSWTPAVAGGLAVLARPGLLPTAVVILVASATVAGGWRARARHLAWGTAVLLAVLLPWIVVSSVKEGRPSLQLSSSGGFNLCLGNNDMADGGWVTAAAKGPCAARVGSPGELADAARLSRKAARWALDNPGRQPGLVAARLERTFEADSYWLDWYPHSRRYEGPSTISDLRNLTHAWWMVASGATLAGAAAGLLRWRWTTSWILVIAISTLLLPVVSVGDSRYHDPLVPFMALLCGLLVAATTRGADGRPAHAGTVLPPEPHAVPDRT